MLGFKCCRDAVHLGHLFISCASDCSSRARLQQEVIPSVDGRGVDMGDVIMHGCTHHEQLSSAWKDQVRNTVVQLGQLASIHMAASCVGLKSIIGT